MTESIPVGTGTLAVPGANLYYELRGTGPLIVLAGSPMTAAPFAPLADTLATDHSVLTTDPRGHGGTVLDDPAQDSTPELRGDDLARLIVHIDRGPAIAFGSSGGASSVLALVQDNPDLVTTAVAHEPPLVELLDDRARRIAAIEDIMATYDAGDRLAAGRKFMAFTEVPVSEEMIDQMYGPGRDPAQLAEEAYFFRHEMLGTTQFLPNIEALRNVPTRLVIGIGETSAGQLCDRASRALAAGLGIEPALFPGGHGGFMEDAEAFAKRLRAVLS
ncbi:alpha/beta fold hydrolase [Nocardia arthritidis]|uniref:Alpha/beta fold hydrolase n=1 Tax=Nocardia arthritidis TaxID=228602 RepID=A0A6G9YG35_9NOCA|nr:alpha/beta hydrolase [Nocardia arthritidis]QIS12181.1 alpha/beta fold hydrolase [Nocardia arthritidis]